MSKNFIMKMHFNNNKTSQNKTSQNKTSQNKTSQNKTSQNKTSQNIFIRPLAARISIPRLNTMFIQPAGIGCGCGR